jgi:hypothetical protein
MSVKSNITFIFNLQVIGADGNWCGVIAGAGGNGRVRVGRIGSNGCGFVE